LGGSQLGGGDIQSALTGDQNVAAALEGAGMDPTLTALEQNPTPAPPSIDPNTLTPGTFDPSLLPNQPNGPPAQTNPWDFFDPSFTPPNQQPNQPGTPAPAPAPSPYSSGMPQAAQLGWADTIGNYLSNALGVTQAQARNAFDPGEEIMSDTPPGPQTVDSTTPGILSTAPVGLGGPFQAGPGNTMTGNQAVDQAIAAGEYSGNLPAWTDMTALSPNVSSPSNSVAAAINEGLATGGLPADAMTNTPATLTGGLVGPGDPGMLSGVSMAQQAPVDFNQITPATGINPNDPNQTIVAKTQPAAAQVVAGSRPTTSFAEEAASLPPYAFAGNQPGAPSAPTPAPAAPVANNNPPAPDTQITQNQPPAQPAPSPDQPSPPSSPPISVPGGPTPDPNGPATPTTQADTAPTDVTNQPDVTSALNTATPGSSTAPVGPAPLTAAALAAPIPSAPSAPDGTPGAGGGGGDGGALTPSADGAGPLPIPGQPFLGGGPNFNPESGVFGMPGTPGGPVPPSLPGNVPGPILGPISQPDMMQQPDGANTNPGLYQVLNNAIDTADGANINPNQGIS
jgi:hypothetical protein